MFAGDPGFPRPVELRFDPEAVPVVFMPPVEERLRPAAATIVVDYLAAGAVNAWGYTCMAFPAAAQTSMQAAADAWEPMINSTVTIRIEACWADLSGSILGGSGALSYWRDFTNRPVAGTFYPVTLANALYGSDLHPASTCTAGGDPVTQCNDMAIIYNNDYINDFYFGTDGITGGKTDFMSVVMHEIAHSLGFAGSMSISSGLGYWGLESGGVYYPTAYDRFTYNNSGSTMLSFTRGTAALATALTTPTMTFRGAETKKAYCETNVPLYTPSSWAQGSSYSHFSDLMDSYDRAQNAMMTFSIGVNQVYHHPGAMALGLLKDVGWNIPAALNVPTGVSAAPASTTSILISWTDNNTSPNETGYVIERSPNGSSSWTVITTTAANATSYTNTGLTTGTPYYYKVRAANGSSIYCASSVVNATPAATLSTPGSLTAAPISPTRVDLAWTDTNTTEDGYRVERSTTSASGPWELIGSTAAGGISYIDQGDPPGTPVAVSEGVRYYYQVTAFKASPAQTSPAAAAQAITPLVTPAAPAAVAVSGAQINLSWSDNSSNETGYKVEWSPNGSSGWAVVTTTAANVQSAQHTGRTEATTYYYRITTVNTVAQSAPTSNVNALTLLNTPTPFVAAQAPAMTTKVNLYWTDLSGLETGFTVERSPNGSSGWVQVCAPAANIQTCSDSTASLGLWYYRIRAVRTTAPANNSAWSANVQVRVTNRFVFAPLIVK
jgi:hypothetical protein